MNACGLIVEYNPFHHGHLYHVQQAKKKSNADCMIAVMSGSFLQRGEPAIIDKYHRTRAALQSGIDIVLELPYAYSVQSSELFAKGAVHTLNEVGVNSLCFGSEAGDIAEFVSVYHLLSKNKDAYNHHLKYYLDEGYSYPKAHAHAIQVIEAGSKSMDFTAPNNILGFSYVHALLEHNLPIKPITIKRTQSNYHDKEINSSIASATSIREELHKNKNVKQQEIIQSVPSAMIHELLTYRKKTETFHHWDDYLQLIYYRVLTMTTAEMSLIQGIDEGIENRIMNTVKQATSVENWIRSIKTKRYTWTRIQRIFTHLLTNTKKSELAYWLNQDTVPYIRILGATSTGRAYLNKHKKNINIPIITSFSKKQHPLLSIEERATNAYYSIFPSDIRSSLFQQELKAPIML